jgi:hypothetical protein
MSTEREKIEAELQADEHDRAIAEVKRAIEEMEDIEAERRLLIECMTDLGMSEAAIERVNMLSDRQAGVVVDALKARSAGHDWPEAAKQLLGDVADAEYSAVDQLAALLESRREAT